MPRLVRGELIEAFASLRNNPYCDLLQTGANIHNFLILKLFFMKKILGLDIGTNSIGAALINIPNNLEDYGTQGNIEWVGSRIIPLDADSLQKFESGAPVETKAAARRMKRGARRLKHRYKLRRNKLIKLFKILGWLPGDCILDDPKKIKEIIREYGEFSYRISDYAPISEESYREFYQEFGYSNEKIDKIIEELNFRKNNKGKRKNPEIKLLPEDWVVYYLRKKALEKPITIAELIRIIYILNQRRGFKSSRKDLKKTTILEYDEFKDLLYIENGEIKVKEEFKGKEYETKFVSITKIKSVEQKGDEKDKKGNLTFIITAEDSRLEPWEEKRKQKPEWEGREFKFVVTQKINKSGKFQQNKPQLPTDDDWDLNMVALDNQIGNKTPGAFFGDKLVEDKNYKIRQFAVKREKYQKELERIWQKQCELNPDLEKINTNQEILKKIVEAFYPTQSKMTPPGPKVKEFLSNDILHIISKDIIYYQRELKSQKHLISECRYEKHRGIDGEFYGVKCAPKTSPEFQEFRIWQDIHNIRIFEKEQKVDNKVNLDVDVTRQFIDATIKEKLFELFDSKREVAEQDIFNLINNHSSEKKLNKDRYRINLFKNRETLPGNETKALFRNIFRKYDYEQAGEKLLSNKETFRQLWHIYYSISSSDLDKSAKGIRTALSKFNLPEEVVEAFTKLPEPKKQYAAYSTKAIKKLLPLMRCGKYWNWNEIHPETQERIEKIIKDGWDFEYDKRTGEIIEEREFTSKEQFAELPVWMACYVVYGRHSERENDKKYTPEELKTLNVMELIPNNSLRNPIVEQVIRETMFLVKDICNTYGQPDEIHIELGRELKKNAAEKERIAQNNAKNLEEKKRIKKLLYELLNDSFEHYDENGHIISTGFEVKPNPENPIDVEKFRIYKSCAAITPDEEKENLDALFKDGKKERIPTNAEIKKYILWLSQRCISPYTGKIIQLSKLFTEEYEVEHIIPQSKIKYDSIENLVICERGVNKLKGNNLAMEFISKNNGAKLHYEGRDYKLLTTEDYITHCKKTFKGRKLKNLLATDIPEDFIDRQINDTRYITRKISELLYPVAKEKEGLVFTIGSITSDLKREWGLNSVWKEIIKPRFERLEEITGQKFIVPEEANKFHFNVPDQPDFNEKRIDHRHHALDALIIAATTREHIRYLNSLSAVNNNQELQKVKYALVKNKIRDFKLPWPNFTKDVKEKLNEIIVTFKSNNKVVSKPSNKYEKWVQKEDGTWEKKKFPQNPNKRWMAIRKSMFKEPQGSIWLKEKREVKVEKAFEIQIQRMKVENDKEKRKTASYIYDKTARQKIKQVIENIGVDVNDTEALWKEIEKYLKKNRKKKNIYNIEGTEFEKVGIAEFVEYAAKRVKLDNSFTHDKIDKIPYAKEGRSPLANLLHEHLKSYNDNPNEAFVGEGIENLTKKAGRRIEKVTIYEKKSPDDKFGNKYVEADKGAIAYFVIYESENTKERPEMYSLATHKAIERLVQGKPIADKKDGYKTIILSPNDLVYVPTEEEWNKIKNGEENPINWNNKKEISKRIYRMVKSTGKSCYFLPAYVSHLILPYDNKKGKGEFGSQNCLEKALDDITIKERCIKIEIDRLGNIKPAI